MQMSAKVLTGVGIVAAVVVIGVAVGWFGAGTVDTKLPNQPNGGSQTSINPPPNRTSPSENPKRDTTKPSAPSQPSITQQNASAPIKPNPQVPAPPPGGYITNWDDRIETILNSDGNESEKSKQMIAMYPQLPEEGKVEVVQHLSNLLDDKDYKGSGMGDWLKDPATPEEVLDALMADVLNRPNATKLPLLLEVAKDPQHPKAEEAKDLLELYLEDDYGKDWTKWQAKTDEWLKQNPD
jgi:hypothetical protein